MSKTDYLLGMRAISSEIYLVFSALFLNRAFLGFVFGAIIAMLIVAFIITKNPKKIPYILRYSPVDSFEKIAKRSKNGTYEMAYSAYLKTYIQIRTLFTVGVLLILTIILSSIITQT